MDWIHLPFSTNNGMIPTCLNSVLTNEGPPNFHHGSFALKFGELPPSVMEYFHIRLTLIMSLAVVLLSLI